MKTDPEAIKQTDKVIEALRLRAAGASYDEIARECGYNSPQAAHKAVSSALKRALREAAEEARELQEQRLDELLFGVWEKATKGNLLAVDRVLAIEKRRASLRGLDMPVKVAETDRDGNDKPAATITFYIPGNGRDAGQEGETKS